MLILETGELVWGSRLNRSGLIEIEEIRFKAAERAKTNWNKLYHRFKLCKGIEKVSYDILYNNPFNNTVCELVKIFRLPHKEIRKLELYKVLKELHSVNKLYNKCNNIFLHVLSTLFEEGVHCFAGASIYINDREYIVSFHKGKVYKLLFPEDNGGLPSYSF